MKRLLLLLGLYLPLLALAATEARVQTRLAPAGDTVVGATVELQVDLLVDTWFTQPPVLPVINLPGATVSAPSGEAQHLNEQHDGKTFFGLRYTYQITPQAAQTFTLAAQSFQVFPGQSDTPITLASEPLTFVAKPLAGDAVGHRLVASNVSLTQQTQLSHSPLRAGDSITRRVLTRAEGTQAMLLPPPPLSEVAGLKRYVQTPKVAPLSDGRGGANGGQREDSVTYVVSAAGHYQLPAIELQWWDAVTGQARQAALPPVEIDVIEGTYKAPFSIDEDLRALGRQAQLRLPAQRLWLIGLLVLGGGLIYLARPWLQAAWRRFKAWQAARRTARLQSADYAWTLARKQLAQSPPELGGLYLWIRRRTGRYTLFEFSQDLPPSLGVRLLDWLQTCYGKATGVIAPSSPMLNQVRRAAAPERRIRKRKGLKPLNP
ncbi:hypothetical protein ACIPZF_17650 [Pseudomonas sp. NPDC089752]|uniref:hypothetical protein n=1 Tax=Pseudomonas sp. NPDC089752 TaxID=3364472 RepID=UPI0037F14E9C